MPTQSIGFATFLEQADLVSRSALCLLALMSVATWTLIVTKLINAIRSGHAARRFTARFWEADSLDAVRQLLRATPASARAGEPFAALVDEALRASEHYAHHAGSRLSDAGTAAEFLTRALRRVIEAQTARLESGLTVLASVGSVAPFIGLFGTVWGVYHALINIGLSGSGTLDRVAGPVGEALIMTALGLAVAIPAVLAYNAFVRLNRLLLGRLDGFAHDVFEIMTTGKSATPNPARPLAPAASGADALTTPKGA